jgi:hypothetical protein
MKRKVMQGGAGLVLLTVAGAAQAQGLTKAKTTLQAFQGELMGLVPIIAMLAGIILVVLWKTNVIRARTLVQWGVGCALIGSVSEIVHLLMG